MQIVITVLASILVFGAIIFVHELGHFLAAKASKIKVNEFAIGMGPRLFHFKKGDTEYSLRLFPIGGFTAMEGEDEESDSAGSFQKAPIGKRILVIVAGALMNLVLGFVVIFGLTASDDQILTRTISGFPEQITVTQNSGLQVGDTIVALNGRRMYVANDILYELIRVKGNTAEMVVIRDGSKVTLKSVQFATEELEDGTTVLLPGFYVNREPATFGNIMKQSFLETAAMTRLIYVSLIDLVIGNVPLKDLSGPVGIVDTISKAAAINFGAVFNIMALISINLGVVNLLPLPALDGGRLFLLLFEGIFKKKLKPKAEAIVNLIGFVLLIGLILIVTYQDITKLFFRG